MNDTYNRYPETLEELMISIEAVQFKEQVTGKPAPYEESIVLTHNMMKDLVRRLQRLERKLAE